MKTKGFILSLFASLLAFSALAQQFPAISIVTVTPPRPIYLPEYYASGATQLSASLVLNDFSVSSWNVRLKVSIEGSSVLVQTRPDYIPSAPIVLTPGVPTVFTGSDFEEYLNSTNATISGIDLAAFNQSGGRLPEGLYKFSVEILDYNSGTPISKAGVAMANLFLEQPPRLMQPQNEAFVRPLTPQNILMSWQAAPGGSPVLVATSQYVLEVYEVFDQNANPMNAVVNGQAQIVYTSQAMPLTTMNLDLTTTQLQAGKKYVWRVRALDALGRDVYANNGWSEWRWFYYGYPTGGIITLNDPVNNSTIRKNDPKVFNWGASSERVQGQQFEYTLTIVEVSEGQSAEDAIANNSAFHSEVFAPSASTNGASFELTKALEPKQKYAWKVVASTEGQQIGESEAWVFYGPPVVEQFNAGNFTVYVTSTENTDINNLDGRGYVQLSEDESDTVSCDFTGVDLKEVSGLMFLEGGEVIFDLSWKDPIELQPKEETNGPADFVFDKGKLDKFGLHYGGIVEWPFPHAVTASVPGMVTSKFTWFVVDENYKIAGTARFAAGENSFELLNPFKHILHLDTTGDFRVASDEYELRATGRFQLNAKIPSNDGLGYIMPFDQQAELQIIEVDYLLANAPNYFTPLEGSSFAIKPWEATIDLSDDDSPGVMSADKGWKGVLFSKFTAIVTSDFDPTNQFNLQYDQEFIVELDSKTEFWTTSQGMHMKWAFEIDRDDDELLSFNQFRCNLEGELNMDDGEVSDSYLRGKFYIPFLDAANTFAFTAPLTTEGVQTGYLEDKLEGRTMSYNPYGGENKFNVEILRAAFADNERIDMNLKIVLPAFDNATFSNVSDFRVYGDNYIGFGERNGKKALDRTLNATYAGYKVKINTVGAAYENDRYSFAILGDADYGPRITGDNGPPKFAISSVMMLDDKFEVRGASVAVTDPVVSIQEGDEDRRKIAAKSFIKIDNKMLEFKGWINLIPDHPTWGNVFTGTIDGKMKFPTDIPMSSNILVGNKEGTDFWYFDAYFQDLEGSGVPIMEPFNMVGFEGRAYYHMRLDGDAFVVDGSKDMGQNGYVQLIDGKTAGGLLQCDMDVELKMEGNNFTSLIKGDLSLLNKNRRKNALAEAGMSAGKELIEELDINLELDVVVPLLASDELGIKITTNNGQAFRYDNEEQDIHASFSSTTTGAPGVGINLSKGENSFNVTGDADGNIEGSLNGGGASATAGFDGNSEGYFDLEYSGLTINSLVDVSKKKATATMVYSGKTLSLVADKQQNFVEGRMEADGNELFTGYKAGKGFLGFDDGTNSLNLTMDPSTQIGVMDIVVGATKMKATAWLPDQKGKFEMKSSSLDITAEGNAQQVGSLLVKETSGKQLTIDFDGPAMNHYFEYLHDATKKFSAELQSGEYAELKMDVDGTAFGIGGNLGADSGRVILKNTDFDVNFYVEPNNTIASLDFDYKTDIDLRATVQPDSAWAQLISGEYTLAITGYNPNAGRLHLAKGPMYVTMYGDQIQRYGTLSLSDGTRTIDAAGCKNGLPAQYAKEAGIQGEFGSFNYKDETYEFGGYYAKDDSLAAKAIINGSGYEAGFNKNEQTYSIRMVDPGVEMNVSGDLNARKLRFGYEEGAVTYTSAADFNDESGSYALKDGSKEYSYNNTSTGFVWTAKDGSTEITATETLTGAAHEIKSGTSAIKAEIGMTETNLIYTDGTITLSTDDDEDVIITDGTNTYAIEESITSAVEIINNGSTESGTTLTQSIGGGTAVLSIANGSRSIAFTKNGETITATADGTDASISGGTWSAANNSSGVSLGGASATLAWANDELQLDLGSGKTFKATADGGTVNYNTIEGEINVDNKMAFRETGNDYAAWMDEWSGIGLEKGEQKAIADINEKLLVQVDNQKYVQLEGATLDLKIDQFSLFIDPTEKLVYDDGSNHYEISPENFNLGYDLSEISITPEGFGLQIDTENYLNFGMDNIDLSVAGIEAGFSVENPLSFASDLGSFNLGVDGLDLSYEDFNMSFLKVDNIPTLSVGSPVGDLDLSAVKLDVSLDAGIDIGFSPETWFDIEAFGTGIEFGDAFSIFNTDLDLGFTLGGDYLASVTSGLGNISIPKVNGISISLPDVGVPFSLSLNPDLSILADVGDVDLGFLKPSNPFDFKLGDFGFTMPSIPNGMGLNVDMAGFTAGYKTIKQELSQVTIGAPAIGSIDFGIDGNENLTIGYTGSGCHFEVTAGEDGLSGKKSGSCSSLSFPAPLMALLQNTAEPPSGGTAEIPAGDGPQYMEGRVSDEAGGFGRGSGEFFVDTENEYIGMNIEFTSTSLVCMENAALSFVSDRGDWSIDIGSASNMVSVEPLCYSLGTEGYFSMDNDHAEFYGEFSWSDDLSVDIGVSEAGAGLSTSVGYSFGLGADIGFDPLGIEEAQVNFSASADVKAHWWLGVDPFSTSGDITLASASLSGELRLNFNSSTVGASGSLSGHAEILDVIETDFDMSISGSL